MGDVIGSGMGEFPRNCHKMHCFVVFFGLFLERILTTAVLCSHPGVTLMVWDHDESLVSGRHKLEEGESANGLRGERRGQQRSNRNRKGSAVDAKLKKKLASLEETETKTKTGCTKEKKAQMRKK